MPPKDARVDDYVAKAAPFAQPLLAWLRENTHGACGELQEDIKWGMPTFVYQGKPVAHMAAFKQHCAFGLCRGDVVDNGKEGEAMGQFGRITTQADLPGAREFHAIIKTAVAKTAADIMNPPEAKRRSAKPLPDMPADLNAALARKPKALKQFKAFAPTHRREYLNWVIEAKREETRRKRIAEIIARLLDGQTRYDKRP